jgi:hypothetical protein
MFSNIDTITLLRSHEPPGARPDSALNVTVIFTSVAATLSALRQAGALASRLQACITLIVLQIVPYPLPVNTPPIPRDFTERQFRVLANQNSVATMVRIYLCRDRQETLRKVLPPHSLVVIGGYRRWWRTPEERLARQLERCGHEVVYAEA